MVDFENIQCSANPNCTNAVDIYLCALAMYTAQEMKLQEMMTALVIFLLHSTATMQQKMRLPWST
jgi:hypothetical protein